MYRTIMWIASITLLGFNAVSPHLLAQPSKQLSKMTPSVRAEVERLMSTDPTTRAAAVAILGDLGPDALPALPWLLALVDDTKRVVSFPQMQEVPISVLAIRSLRKLGTLETVSQMADDPNSPMQTRINAAVALTMLGTPGSADRILSLIPLVAQPGGDSSQLRDLTMVMHCTTKLVDMMDLLLKKAEEWPPESRDRSFVLDDWRNWVVDGPGRDFDSTFSERKDWWAAHRSIGSLLKLEYMNEDCANAQK